MKRINDVGSVFGTAQRTSYEYLKFFKKKYGNDYKILVVDDKDGLHSIPFASHGATVTMYEPDITYTNGGYIDGIEVKPIHNRKNYSNCSDRIEIRNKNFYEERIEERYEFVYCYRSLHEKHNKGIPMKRKIRKLQSSVKEGGYLYIFYHIAKNERDISNYSVNRYFRKGEMKEYFNTKQWKLISIIENERETEHQSHPYHKKKHKHKVGHIFAKKKNTRLVHKYYYNIVDVF